MKRPSVSFNHDKRAFDRDTGNFLGKLTIDGEVRETEVSYTFAIDPIKMVVNTVKLPQEFPFIVEPEQKIEELKQKGFADFVYKDEYEKTIKGDK